MSKYSSKNYSNAKVGVFMPCYNMGPFIDEALESLYKQTFQDFIVIIADDASPQKSTRDKLSKITLPRCKVYFEKKNIGLVGISNKYMDKLDTDYIVLFSPDDKLHPDFLQEQVEYLDRNKDVHAVSTWVQEFDEGDTVIKYTDASCRLPGMLVENRFSGAALIRKQSWLEAGRYDPDKEFYPNLDYDLWLSMLDKGLKLGVIPKPLFYWRVVGNSLSHSLDASRMLIFRKALFKKYQRLYEEYSSYVIENYLDKISKFEEYYAISEEGHDWLDQQYKNLTKENAILKLELDHSIRRPYARSVYKKAKRFINKKLH